MAKVTDLGTLAKTSVASTDFLLVTSSNSGQSKKLTVESLFPSVSTAGTSSEALYNSATLTNKNQIAFKGIKSGDTGLLTVGTTSSNLVLTVLEAGVDLSLCNNATSGFISGIDFTGTVTGVNPVVNGGTGISTIAKGAMLYASAEDTIAATAAMSTNGQLLIGNATTGYASVATLTAGSGITITNAAGAITLAATITNAEANIDMRNAANNATYNVDLVGGTAFISGDGTAEGLTNTDAPTIKPTATTSSTAGQALTIESGSSAGAGAGNLNLIGGSASGNGAGGSVVITAGRDTSGSADGIVKLSTYTSGTATAGLTVEKEGQNVTINTGDLVIAQAAKGIVHTGTGTVTQESNHTTGVTINATSGKITLAASALAAATNAEFTVTNSTVTANSIIMLTVQDENTTNNAQLTACTHTIASGSFKVSLHNPAATGATSATSSKIHFLVIN